MLHQDIYESVTRLVSNVAQKKTSQTDTSSPGGRTTRGGIYLRTVIVILSVGAVTLGIVKIIMIILSGIGINLELKDLMN